VLIQLGLMPEYLPFPRAMLNGDAEKFVTNGDAPKRLEYRVPATGLDQPRKLREKDSVPSNGMFEYRVRSVE
jgi:carboxymethylenebutenolidase